MPPKKNKSATTGNGKQRQTRSPSSFLFSGKRDGASTGNDDGAVRYHLLPGIVRNRIYAGENDVIIAQARSREAAAVRHDAQIQADRDHRDRVKRDYQKATRERREKEADSDLCGQGASRTARTAVVAAEV